MPIEKQFVHCDRLLSASKDSRLSAEKITVIQNCILHYENYKKSFYEAIKKEDYKTQISLLDGYLNSAKSLEIEHGFLATRTKYYSSILEEVPTLILENKIDSFIDKYNLQDRKLYIGGQDCVIRIAANPDGTPFYEKKRIDFVLAVDACNDGKWIPLVGLEVKKYLDKTMFGTVIETYNSLRVFRPRSFYGFLVEDEARSAEVVANSVMYKNEFVLSKKNHNKVSSNDIDLEEYKRFSMTLCSTVEEALKELNIGGF